MAKLIGSELHNGNFGEDKLCKALMAAYPDDHIIYRNEAVFGREFDIAMLIPEIGIAIFEAKGWKESTVKQVKLQNKKTIVISTEDGDVEQNPYEQVRGYRFAVERRLRSTLGRAPVVFGMVAYPHISKEFYVSSKMNAISEEMFTLLEEDFASAFSLQSKIARAISEVVYWKRTKFDSEYMYNTRCIFEGDLPEEMRPELKKNVDKKKHYSVFYYIPESENMESLCAEIEQLYFSGCKVYAVVEKPNQIKYISDSIDRVLEKKYLFRIKGNLAIRHELEQKNYPEIVDDALTFNAFNCSVNLLYNMNAPVSHLIRVLDGNYLPYEHEMELISKNSDFNFEQYIIEHTAVGKNILIRAGAGTGKTHTMISRIGFIAYAGGGLLSDLTDRIIMITFTNEAADQMRRKVKEFFRNSYLLSGDNSWVILIQNIDKMQISTIHTFAKVLIDGLGTDFGYGIDSSITSSEYDRGVIATRLINEYVIAHQQLNSKFVEELHVPMYQIVADVVEFIKKLQNKSIDVSKLSEEAFGVPAWNTQNPDLHNLITYVVPKVEETYQSYLKDNNILHLSSIMSLLQMMLSDKRCQKRLVEQKMITAEYLFVDEFQDTDNTQIRILSKLCELIRAKLFVVGDIKQCIYRFRGATEEAFAQLPIEGHENEWEIKELRKNYRTDADLLNLFDMSFRDWGNDDDRLLEYKSEDNKLIGTKHFNTGRRAKEYYSRLLIRTNEGRMEALFREIQRVKEEIEQLIAGGTNLSSEEKTIAILVRENWQAEEIKRAGSQRNIVIETNTGGDLYQTDAALDMLSLVEALLHYDEPEYLYALASSNFIRVELSNSWIYSIRERIRQAAWRDNGSTKKEMSNALIETINVALTKMPKDCNTWDTLVASLRTKPVLQVLYCIYDTLCPEKNSSDNINRQLSYKMNVDLLFEQVLTMVNTDQLTINSFAKSLSLAVYSKKSVNSRSINTEEEINIKCITVHKSKGLEYGYVILPYTNQPLRKLKHVKLNVTAEDSKSLPLIGYSLELEDHRSYNNSNYNENVEIEEKAREETRVLYVAMTRAIKSFSWIAQEDNREQSWQSLIEIVEE